VANFICGIILLFERPIRVGDVVSVAGVSGTVSKIKMRATTIVNFDREEFVVPNKEFITGSLINMTLSSPINRVLIPVGVAYGSDTEEVLRILSEVAKGVDGVMEEPAPVITFESFGDSSLDFMVRAYLPSRENRLGVITELHRQIDRRFAEANIEIPFPQRDLHLRSVDEDIPFRGQSKP
jgi:potassium efflux system protein